MRLLVQDPLTLEPLVYVDLVSKSGEKVRNWGGWYRHDPILAEGVRVGAVQVRRRHGRVEVMTSNDRQSCVLGSDWEWCFWDFVGRGLVNIARCENGHEVIGRGVQRGQCGWCIQCTSKSDWGGRSGMTYNAGLVPFTVQEYRLEA